MTRIMSIDVGLKNLAICVLELSATTLTLYDWTVLNLVPSISCDTCKQPAQFHKKGRYVCRKHAKTLLIDNHKYTIPTKHSDLSILSKKSKAYLIELIQTTYCPTVFDTIQLQDIKKYKKDELLAYIESRIPPMYERITPPKTSEVSFVDYGIRIVEQVDPILSRHSIDAVLIENQISPLANRMKTLQGMLTQYFVMRNIPTIEYISSANKLKVQHWTEHGNKHESRNTGQKEYANRKKAGVLLTQYLINHPVLYTKKVFEKIENINTNDLKNEKGIFQLDVQRGDHFSTHKKKDDLADAFLQGVWWLIVHENDHETK